MLSCQDFPELATRTGVGHIMAIKLGGLEEPAAPATEETCLRVPYSFQKDRHTGRWYNPSAPAAKCSALH